MGEQLAMLEANELHFKFHGVNHDFKDKMVELVREHLGLKYTPPTKLERETKMHRRLKQKQLRDTPEWQAKKKVKRNEKRAQMAKSKESKEAETGSSGAYQPGGFYRGPGPTDNEAAFPGLSLLDDEEIGASEDETDAAVQAAEKVF